VFAEAPEKVETVREERRLKIIAGSFPKRFVSIAMTVRSAAISAAGVTPKTIFIGVRHFLIPTGQPDITNRTIEGA
jgi:hypothetical protein